MSITNQCRIKRGQPPKKTLKRTTYKEAMPELKRDFGGRCAYSMQHEERCGALEVDHFDPNKKNYEIQVYENLFPASRHCNGHKSNTWPTEEEKRAGCRFLNPCAELDYDEQIFEDPTTHWLYGITPAAKWHIRVCGLNGDLLVGERKLRSEIWKDLEDRPLQIIGDLLEACKITEDLRKVAEVMIPRIKPGPISPRI